MKILSVLIVDDEPLAHQVLEGYCQKIDYIKVVGNCYDGIATFNFLNEHHVDLVLLDIQLPDLTGVDLLESIKSNGPKIVFTTAFSDYALQSFEYDQVIDYLLKPIRVSRFMKAMDRVKTQLELEQRFQEQPQTALPDQVKSAEFISLYDNKTIYQVRIDEIVYIQSWGNYLKVFLENDQMKIVRKTIKGVEKELPSKIFIRIHKSYLVNKNKIVALEGNCIMLKDLELPIGKSYQMMVKERLMYHRP